jgi:vacuolar-type H+-ATPase subunit I/STV1
VCRSGVHTKKIGFATPAVEEPFVARHLFETDLLDIVEFVLVFQGIVRTVAIDSVEPVIESDGRLQTIADETHIFDRSVNVFFDLLEDLRHIVLIKAEIPGRRFGVESPYLNPVVKLIGNNGEDKNLRKKELLEDLAKSEDENDGPYDRLDECGTRYIEGIE